MDGGPSGEAITSALGRHLPFDDRRLDLVILTHPQLDHIGGLPTVVNEYSVRRVLSSPSQIDSAAYTAWSDALRLNNVPLVPAERGQTVAEKLVEILAELFEFLQNNRELMRIAFATAFAAPGEVPAEVHYAEKCARNFEFVHDLIRRGQAAGELDCRFDSKELAFGIYGQLSLYSMAHLRMPDCRLDRQTAERDRNASARWRRTADR